MGVQPKNAVKVVLYVKSTVQSYTFNRFLLHQFSDGPFLLPDDHEEDHENLADLCHQTEALILDH